MRDGFSLVEVIVSVGILVLLSGMFLGYNRSSEEQVALFKDQALLVGAINKVKALAQEKSPQAENECAFGVRIDTERNFFIFSDKPNSGGFCITEGAGETDVFTSDFKYTNGIDQVTEQFSLDGRLRFSSGVGSDFVFIPPNLELRVTPDVLPARIEIKNTGNTRTAAVTITTGGQIVTE